MTPKSETNATQRDPARPLPSTEPAPARVGGGGEIGSKPDRPLVLFDGTCSLCKREIAHYRRRQGANGVEWVDLAGFSSGQLVHGIDYDTAMSRFHVRDSKGSWHRGADAFVELWLQLPAYRLVGKTVRRSGLTPLLDRAYARFAQWRLRRRCLDNSCRVRSGRIDDTGATRRGTGNDAPLGDI